MGSAFIRVAITPPYIYPGEPDAIGSLLRSGDYDYVHIRKPDASEAATRELVSAIDPSLRGLLALHDHYHLANEMHCGGIHLNRRNPLPPAGWAGRISRSCHSTSELYESAGCDYVFLSPVYPSISKPGYSSALLDDPELPGTLRSARIPVVALGGVTADRFEALKWLGFSGAAMLGATWRGSGINPEAFRLQLISHPYPGQSIAEGIAKALKGGCRWIQLRHKDADLPTLLTDGRAIAALRREYDFTFIVDDHVELVMQTGADGVHLGKNDLPVAQARRLLGPGKIIGATANTIDDIYRAAHDGADYIGLGPFRFTTTKERLAPILGTDGYRAIITEIRSKGIFLPIVAIGGITLPDVPELLTTGIDGVAVSGAILGSPDPVASTTSFISKLITT